MPEAKHTPGPWIVDEVNTPNGVGYFVNHLWEAEDDGDGPETRTDEIAEVCMDYNDPEIPLGNARLMAAAPDLLAALKDATNALESQAPGNPRVGPIESCRNAIAKAEGR